MTTTALDPKLVRERLLRFLKTAKEQDRAISQNDVARSLGCSGPLISAFINEDARGDVQRLCRRLTAYLDEQDLKARAGELFLPYVDTRQTRMARQTLELAQIHHWIVAIISESGHGKTIAIDQYVAEHPSTIILKPWVTSCPSAILKNLCETIGESDRGDARAFEKRIVYRLRGADRLLIVDDAHDLAPKSLQVLRNVYDATNIGLALVGNSPLEVKLSGVTPELEQIARRVMYKRRLPSWSEADAKQQIAKTLPHLDAAKVLETFHPKAKQSPAWVAKTIAAAGRLTQEQSIRQIGLDQLREALQMVA